MRLIAIALFGISTVFTSCTQQETTSSTQEEQTTAVTKRVSKEEFKQALGELEDFQLIDVRTPGEFSGGNIEGAMNIDFRNTNFKTEVEKLDKSKPTLIYCHGGGRSMAALNIMKEMGFQHVFELEGGYSNW